MFPGAEGFGTDTLAGRGGQVLVVDTLAPAGPGSLARALQTTGPRTIVFEVGGIVWLQENLSISEPFVTVAGQTAPAPGITLAGAGLVIDTHDVLIQHIAIRPGDREDGPPGPVRDALQVIGSQSGDTETYNVVADHLSLTWSVDEVFSTWYRGVHDITLSNSLVAEALDDSLHPEGPHSKGVLVGDHTRRVALLGNVFAYNIDRNPIFKGDVSALASHNLVIDPGRWPVTHYDPEGSGPSLMTVQHNVFRRGADTPEEHSTVQVHRSARPGTALFLTGNTSWDIDGDDWEGVTFLSERDAEEARAHAPPVTVLPLTIPEDVEAAALNGAGARPAQRDPIDTRIFGQIANGDGRVIDSQRAVGGWTDGPMSHHEITLPLDPSADPDGDGYTELEHWLHDRAREVEGR